MKFNSRELFRLNLLIVALSLFFLSSQRVYAGATTTPDTATTTPDVATSTDPAIPPSPVSVFLDIESSTSTIFNGQVDVLPCSVSSSSTPSLSAYCAIQQSGVVSEWSSFGDDVFLSSVGGVGNDYANNLYWNWFSNLEYGQTSLNQHTVSVGERLLVTIGRLPLKLSVSTTTPAVFGTTTATVRRFSFDASWNGVWVLSTSSIIKMEGNEYTLGDFGTLDIVPATNTPIIIYASESGYLDSPSVSIFPVVEDYSFSTSTSTTTPPLSDEPPSGGCCGGGTVYNKKVFDLNKALSFLITRQEADGSFASGFYTDWAIIAISLGTDRLAKERAIAYLKSRDIDSNNVTDYERRAMALMSLGLSPYDGTSVNYIKKIAGYFDGAQIGDTSLVNDDIFAVFPLINSGYTISDQIIRKTLDFIVSKQRPDGSWEGSIDMTAAAIQALELVHGFYPVESSISRARQYLVSVQQSDAGFGSAFSSSWVIQAIVAMGESVNNWVKTSVTLEEYMANAQEVDGAVGSISLDSNTRLWATSYAIPAMSGKTWGMVLKRFDKPVVVAPSNFLINSSASSTATSTVLVSATSTPPVVSATSTPQVLADASVATSSVHSPSISDEVVSVIIETEPKVHKAVVATFDEEASVGEDDRDVASSSQVASVVVFGKSSPLGILLVVLSVLALFYFRRFR